ncbi:hypothetical protein MHUMG1_10568 [Metarhizium humberi]|uniref:Uncharacterized protein n=1 Tax=Metarhizium humberi TaxID=2596975 RepID=A0A9P8M183_9HYPO|nr:hypothetical protein MHUMG1_10568 [Metarhizium humberi]
MARIRSRDFYGKVEQHDPKIVEIPVDIPAIFKIGHDGDTMFLPKSWQVTGGCGEERTTISTHVPLRKKAKLAISSFYQFGNYSKNKDAFRVIRGFEISLPAMVVMVPQATTCMSPRPHESWDEAEVIDPEDDDFWG